MAQVKICGLKDTAHIRAAAEAGADWVGFVLFPKSPRNLLGVGEDGLDEVIDLSEFAQELGLLSVILLVDPDEDLFEDVLHRSFTSSSKRKPLPPSRESTDTCLNHLKAQIMC